MLKLLNRLLPRRGVAPVAGAVPTRPLRPAMEAPPPPPEVLHDTLSEWLRRVLGHLPAFERERLQQRIANNLRYGDLPADAMINALLGDGGQQHGHWAMLHIDLSAIEEIEWQARELALAARIHELYGWDWHEHRSRPARAALLELHAWLSRFGYALLQMDSGRMEYCMLLVAAADVDDAVQQGARLGVSLGLLRDD